MLEWHDYIQRLLTQESSFDGITMSIGTGENVEVPPIIKASILMLDRMQKCQGKRNILVFPERVQSIFIFTLSKLLHNIFEGRIDKAYDPSTFTLGEKLRIGKAVVEFLGIEERKNYSGKFMRIRTKDTIYSMPLEILPLFQKTNAEKISTGRLYDEEREKARRQYQYQSRDELFLKTLSDYRTHMDSSIVYMTSIINAKEMINSCKLCGHLAKNLLLVGQVDYSGQVKNISAGQLGGTPAIILAADLYAIAGLARSGHPVQSIIIDASNAGALQNQMDALDELLRLDVPITCVTDIVNSFDLNQFIDRGFNMWRWDETSITPALYDKSTITADRKTKHCVKKTLRYLIAEGYDISTAVRILSSHRSESDAMSAPMLKLFEKLFSLVFNILRDINPINSQYKERVHSILDGCTTILQTEKSFLSQEAYEDYVTVIESIQKAVAVSQPCQKHDLLLEHLIENRYRNICIIVPEGSDKKTVQEYWRFLCLRRRLPTIVNVLYPAEYYIAPCAQYDTTIVVGWMKRAIMRKILYSFNTESYVVLLYGCEKQWKNHATKRWNKALDRTQNRKTVEKSFATDKFQVSTTRFIQEPEPAEDSLATDEYSEIEVALRDNKFRQYIARGGHKHAGETVEAVPVNYVGGYLAFYRTGHTVISATRIILEDADRIDTALPENLKLGDFVVVRESGKDLIKEMADAILERDGKAGMRAMATKWREALIIEQLFSTPDEIYQKLKAAGCTKGFQTIRKWLFDDSIIAPQDKQDLEHIAVVTESGVLKELNDQIFDAAQTVKAAHIHAGRVLSVQLRNRIVESLNEYGDIDPFNIWEPIEMVVDGVGTVRVLKVIDIGESVIVDISDTNRLITED